jgi:hypothetical protein
VTISCSMFSCCVLCCVWCVCVACMRLKYTICMQQHRKERHRHPHSNHSPPQSFACTPVSRCHHHLLASIAPHCYGLPRPTLLWTPLRRLAMAPPHPSFPPPPPPKHSPCGAHVCDVPQSQATAPTCPAERRSVTSPRRQRRLPPTPSHSEAAAPGAAAPSKAAAPSEAPAPSEAATPYEASAPCEDV